MGTPSIIIVDDNEDVRVATQNLVESYGFDARVFASAEAVLESGDVEGAACLVADVQMPGMGGFELHRALIARGRRLPIVFITAFPEARLRDEAVAVGALGFLSKPFEAAALIECVEAALGRP
ncbi:response regulator transcription factor [Methylocella sp.]|uniref:response regulator transcription factor n=1 Tax=Methylocella sp. TaxID=1978226 RepID=UPI003784C6EB